MDAGAMYNIGKGYALRSAGETKSQLDAQKTSESTMLPESLPGDQVELGAGSPEPKGDLKTLAGKLAKTEIGLGLGNAASLGLMGGLLGAFGGLGGMGFLGGIGGALIGGSVGSLGLGLGGITAFHGGLGKGNEAPATSEKSGPARTRNADGRFRTKSGKTKLETLRGTYGLDFAAGLPGNMPLGLLRASTGESLTQLLKNPDKIQAVKPDLENWQAPELAPGGRTRNADGRIRAKSGSTKLETLRGTYGLDFAAGLPGNMPLGILRAATGESLTQLLKNPDKIEDVRPQLENWAPEYPPTYEAPSVTSLDQTVSFPSTYDSPNIISPGPTESSSGFPSASLVTLKGDADTAEFLIR